MAGVDIAGAAAVAACGVGGLKIDLRLAAEDVAVLPEGVELLLLLPLLAVGQADLEKQGQSQMCRVHCEIMFGCSCRPCWGRLWRRRVAREKGAVVQIDRQRLRVFWEAADIRRGADLFCLG